jgi:serine/threonine protein kinase
LELCAGGALDKLLTKARELIERNGLSGSDSSLSAGGNGTAVFGWQQRLQVAVGIGRALVHLHTLPTPMIHRDVKTQNVLMTGVGGTTTTTSSDSSDSTDDSTNASTSTSGAGMEMLSRTKVADFGTVREDVRRKANSQLTTGTGNKRSHGTTENIIGTMPYMPVEYFMQGRVSDKTDAFAFGIVLIELITTLPVMQARAIIENCPDPFVGAAVQADPATKKVGWPEEVVKVMVQVVERCTFHKHKMRSSVSAEISKLERQMELYANPHVE